MEGSTSSHLAIHGMNKRWRVRQSMDLVLVKKQEIWGREIMGVLMKYGFELYREIKEIRLRNDGGLTK